MNEQNIAEILCDAICTHSSRQSQERCKTSGGCETLKPTIEAILALIASEQAEHDIEVADVAFDKGFDVGKTEAKIEAEAKYKPMVEALKEAKKQILHIEDKSSKAFTSTDMVLAKIDAVLPKGEGK